MRSQLKSNGDTSRLGALFLAGLITATTAPAFAADIFWTGPSASYTNAANWGGGVVPGASDNAITTNGLANRVQINAGNPDWTVVDLQAGSAEGTAGAYEQNGQTVNVKGWARFGLAPNSTGAYTLNAGTLSILGGKLFLGEAAGSDAVFTMNGGVLNKTGDIIVLADAGWGGAHTGTASFVQNGGTINSSSEFWIGQLSGGTATYNLHAGGVLNSSNWLVVARAGSVGTLNMDGGSITHVSGGQPAFIVGDRAGVDGGHGTLNFSGGNITTIGAEFWLGNGNNTTFGTNNMSGNASLTVNNWIAVGRGGTGVLNLSGNASVTKTGNGNVVVAGTGIINQSGGSFTVSSGEIWLPENGSGTWNLSGGTATIGVLQFCRGGNGTGSLYLNGGLLNAYEINCGIAQANGTFYFNGGILQAKADNVNFFHGLGGAYVDAGGAVIDSQNFNITMAQTLSDLPGGGGLTKLGSGTLTLSGFNSYSGPTLVNAGTLAVTTDSAASSIGGYTVANGAKLGVKVQYANAYLNTASLTFNSGATTLEADLGNFGNPTTAPVILGGNLAVNGTVTINLVDAMPQIGQFPLIQYGTKSGAGNFVIGTLPVGVVANIVNNVGNNSIDINITSVNLPRWDGLAGGNWDIGQTANWVNIGNGLPTTYSQGNAVMFDDNAAGTTTVNLVANVTPNGVTFNNTNLPYMLGGSGKISGSAGLTKQGDNVAIIANTSGNDYTGKTVISGGALVVSSLANGGQPSAIGASSASPTNLVLAGGALSYSGPAVAINRGYTLQGPGGIIDIDTAAKLTLSGTVAAAQNSGFMKTGLGQLTYTTPGSNVLTGVGAEGYLVTGGSVLFDGSANGQTNIVQGALGIAGETANATVVLTNSQFATTANVDVGINPGTTGTLTIASNSTVSVGSWMTLGDAPNSTATVNLNGGTITVNSGRLFLGSAPGTMSTLNINGGTINKNGDYFAVVDGGWNGTGARTGIVNQVSGTVNSTSELWVGDRGGLGGNDSLGVYNLSGGSLTVNNWMGIGRDGSRGIFTQTGGTLNKGDGGDLVVGRGGNGTIGIFNLSGGTLTKAGGNPMIIGQGGGRGELNHSGGTLNLGSEFWVGVDNTTIEATNNISGTAVVNINNWVSLGRGGQATINFMGGNFNKGGGGQFIVGEGAGKCDWNQTGGALNINSELWIAQAGGTVSSFNLSSGTVTNNSWLAVGREGGNGTLNISGGTMVKQGGGNISITHGGGASGTVNQTGGEFFCVQGETWIGEDSGPAVWNMQNGLAGFGYVQLARDGSATGTLNLDGGMFAVAELAGGGGNSTVNLNGGILVALADNDNFVHGLTAANVLAGGATIETITNTVSINQVLLDGGGNGGLVKSGAGTLHLNGVNTYTGNTVVYEGTLGGNGVIAGAVNVVAGATLAPGTFIGTLTVNGAVTLAAGSTTAMEVSKNGSTNDLVTGATAINYGGTLVLKNLGGVLAVNDTFKLFNASSYSGSFSSVVSQTPGQTITWDLSNLTVNGTVRVASAVAAPVTMVSVPNGSTMNLSWPEVGWRLEVQTNSVTVGLNTNWATVPGSTSVTSMSVPIIPGNPTVFYRLVFP